LQFNENISLEAAVSEKQNNQTKIMYILYVYVCMYVYAEDVHFSIGASLLTFVEGESLVKTVNIEKDNLT
jgi:hypothetical protein